MEDIPFHLTRLCPRAGRRKGGLDQGACGAGVLLRNGGQSSQVIVAVFTAFDQIRPWHEALPGASSASIVDHYVFSRISSLLVAVLGLFFGL